MPGSLVFSQHYENWYTDHLLAPGLAKRSDMRRWLNEIWHAQRRIQRVLNEEP